MIFAMEFLFVIAGDDLALECSLLPTRLSDGGSGGGGLCATLGEVNRLMLGFLNSGLILGSGFLVGVESDGVLFNMLVIE